jgi:hypothetical protein
MWPQRLHALHLIRFVQLGLEWPERRQQTQNGFCGLFWICVDPALLKVTALLAVIAPVRWALPDDWGRFDEGAIMWDLGMELVGFGKIARDLRAWT